MTFIRKLLAMLCYRCEGNPGGGCRDCGVTQTGSADK